MIVVSVSLTAIENLFRLRPVLTQEPLALATLVNEYANERYLQDPEFFENLQDRFAFETNGLAVYGQRTGEVEFVVTDVTELPVIPYDPVIPPDPIP